MIAEMDEEPWVVDEKIKQCKPNQMLLDLPLNRHVCLTTYLYNGDMRFPVHFPPPHGTQTVPDSRNQYLSDYSDARDWHPKDTGEISQVWQLIQPTLRSFTKITNQKIEYCEIQRVLTLGYNATYDYIKKQLMEWIYRMHGSTVKSQDRYIERKTVFVPVPKLPGYSEQIEQVTERTTNPLNLRFFDRDGNLTSEAEARLFKLDRWYGPYSHHVYAPNLPAGPEASSNNPEAARCARCSDSDLNCYGWKEHPSHQCYHCVSQGVLCSNQDSYQELLGEQKWAAMKPNPTTPSPASSNRFASVRRPPAPASRVPNTVRRSSSTPIGPPPISSTNGGMPGGKLQENRRRVLQHSRAGPQNRPGFGPNEIPEHLQQQSTPRNSSQRQSESITRSQPTCSSPRQELQPATHVQRMSVIPRVNNVDNHRRISGQASPPLQTHPVVSNNRFASLDTPVATTPFQSNTQAFNPLHNINFNRQTTGQPQIQAVHHLHNSSPSRQAAAYRHNQQGHPSFQQDQRHSLQYQNVRPASINAASPDADPSIPFVSIPQSMAVVTPVAPNLAPTMLRKRGRDDDSSKQQQNGPNDNLRSIKRPRSSTSQTMSSVAMSPAPSTGYQNLRGGQTNDMGTQRQLGAAIAMNRFNVNRRTQGLSQASANHVQPPVFEQRQSEAARSSGTTHFPQLNWPHRQSQDMASNIANQMSAQTQARLPPLTFSNPMGMGQDVKQRASRMQMLHTLPPLQGAYLQPLNSHLQSPAPQSPASGDARLPQDTQSGQRYSNIVPDFNQGSPSLPGSISHLQSQATRTRQRSQIDAISPKSHPTDL